MHDHSSHRRHGAPRRSAVERVEAYLRSRTPEHWAFFAAGFVAAAILT